MYMCQIFRGFNSDAPRLDTPLVNCLMYADDLVLMSRTEIGLQDLIDKLNNYMEGSGSATI